jgi:hypothetical protein
MFGRSRTARLEARLVELEAERDLRMGAPGWAGDGIRAVGWVFPMVPRGGAVGQSPRPAWANNSDSSRRISFVGRERGARAGYRMGRPAALAMLRLDRCWIKLAIYTAISSGLS